ANAQAPLPEPAATEAAEDPPTHAGRYELEGEVGQGGMGAVLRARDPAFNRRLAVKLLHARFRDNADLKKRFLEEAQLQHPGVPPVHDRGELPDGRPYFVMKLIKGQTLADLLKERTDTAQELPRFLTVFLQVCQTVGYAHSRGILHRDL